MGNFLRTIFIWLDNVIYSLISLAYNLILDIAGVDILSETTINAFADRVYALLAVFMLFRLSFSILTYIINPDNSTDKSGGAGKLVGNVLITLVMLISAPWIFNQAREIQKSLLNENIVGKIILGTTETNDFVTQQIDPGNNMAWTTFEAFFYLEDWSDGNAKTSSGLTANEAYERAEKAKDINFIQKSGLSSLTACRDGSNSCKDEEFVFKYLPLISTITGAFIAYILILFSFQIAVRSVKLSFLQLIAPIPIISYIDPKQGKDGMFKKWYKLCLKTYADLFLRLAAIYFAVFVISEIPKIFENGTTFASSSGLIKVIVIIGALMFAKELPKFIEEITGVKLSGGFSLNPFKNNALLGGFVGGALGAGLGAVGGFAGNLAAGNKMRDAVRGGLKGFASGGMGGIKDKGLKKDTFTRGSKAGVATGTNYANWRAAGSTMGGRLSDRMMSSMGAKTAAERFDEQIKAYDDIAGLHKNTEDYVIGELAKAKNAGYNKYSGGLEYEDAITGQKMSLGSGNFDYAEETAKLEQIRNGTVKGDLVQQQRIVDALKEKVVDNYVINAGDDAVASFVSQADSIAKQNDISVKSVTASTFRAAKKTSKHDSSEIKGSDAYKAAKANANANKEAKASKK